MSRIDVNKLEEKFYIGLKDKENALFSIPAMDLLHKENMDRLIHTYAPLIKALEPAAAATYFCSWFGFTGLALQYFLSVHNKVIDLSLANLTIQLYEKDQYYAFSFKVNQLTEQDAPIDDQERAEWRNRVLTDFYSKTILPLFEAISDAVEIDAGQLWGQLPNKFHYYINSWVENDDYVTSKHRITDDFQFLIRELDSNVFGRKKNPFDVKFRMIEDIEDSAKHVRMKNACCLYYRTEGGRYCYTCPRMKEEERAQWREKYRTEMKEKAAAN